MTDSTASNDYAGVLTLLHHYAEGLWRADADALREAFSASARYATLQDGALLELGMDEYLPRVARRTPPREQGDPLEYTVDGIDFAGPDTALARLRCSFFGFDYVDLLTLLRLEGRWRIQSKVFHATPVAGKGA